jgi:pimeloyl-ACP methyl ester carboxylesterase
MASRFGTNFQLSRGSPMPEFIFNGTAVFYGEQGEGVPFIFQHGLGADHRQGLAALSELKGYRLVAADCPGHGASICPDNTRMGFDTYADVVVALLDHLNIASAVFGGISMGSGIAANITLRHPDRVKALVLVRPAWVDAGVPPNLRIVAQLGKWIEEHGVERAEELLSADPFYAEALVGNPGCAASIAGGLTRPQAVEGAPVLYQMVNSQPIAHMRDLASVHRPVLVVSSDSDPLHPVDMAKTWTASLPNAVHEHIAPRYLDSEGHHAELNHVVQTFLSAAMAASSQPGGVTT